MKLSDDTIKSYTIWEKLDIIRELAIKENNVELEAIVNSVTDDVEVLHAEIQLLEDEVTDLSI